MDTNTQQPSTEAQTSQLSQPSDTKKDPNSLPPEALDLAQKLFDLARSGQTSQLLPYLDAGIPPNLTNSEGNTLLMLAAYSGHASTVSVLLTRGADPNVLNDRGQSPLAGAVFKGYDGVVKVLVEEGKADGWAGQPNAVECGRMFKRYEALRIMGIEAETGS
jgi:ankyrin repeat protein